MGEQIFELRGPAWRKRNLDPGSERPTGSPPEHRFFGAGNRSSADRRASKLGSCELVVGPGEPAYSIDQPIAKWVADAAAHRPALLHHLPVPRLPNPSRRTLL